MTIILKSKLFTKNARAKTINFFYYCSLFDIVHKMCTRNNSHSAWCLKKTDTPLILLDY